MQITYGQNDWLPIGDGQWSWAGGAIQQTSVGTSDPQELYFHIGSGGDVSRTVSARLHFTAVNFDNDGRVGISLLNDGQNGVDLTYHADGGKLQFLQDHAAWSDDYMLFQPAIGSYWLFKAFYDAAAGTCYGKCWQDGASEPEAWQLSFRPQRDIDDYDDDPVNYQYSGVVGNSFAGTLAVVDDFSVVLASEVPAFKPLFRPRNHLIGGGI